MKLLLLLLLVTLSGTAAADVRCYTNAIQNGFWVTVIDRNCLARIELQETAEALKLVRLISADPKLLQELKDRRDKELDRLMCMSVPKAPVSEECK